MKILITGSGGFIGKNLVHHLGNLGYDQLLLYDTHSREELLDSFTKECDFVFHLAGVNRPREDSEFIQGNCQFTSVLLQLLEKNNNKCPFLLTSSTQAALDNPYGKSKKIGEDLVFAYGRRLGVRVLIYRLPNVFGKWARPNYNSAVATFCHNIAHELPICVHDPDVNMQLVYIDDVLTAFTDALQGKECQNPPYCLVNPVHQRKLGEIADLLHSFYQSRKTLLLPSLADPFVKNLYSTYLSYLPKESFAYPLKMHIDPRGSFTEFLKMEGYGQVSVNVSRPGITKGNHWHHTKNEKFLVVSGKGTISLRKIGTDEIIEYFVSSDKLQVVDIPVGYTHTITNTGDTDLVTIIWVNEIFDPDCTDTYPLNL